MSYGLCICDQCQHEVHQDGPDHAWRHCEDKTTICLEGKPIYAKQEDVVGKCCLRDDF